MFSERKHLSLASSLGIVFTSCLIVNVLGIIYQFFCFLGPEPSYSNTLVDRPRELTSDVRFVNMKFHDDPLHYDITSMNSSAEWNGLQPLGGGVVFLGDLYTPFEVSVWHQLRCLNHIRAYMNSETTDYQHMKHCFHYLRQSILCSSDTTLEPIRMTPGRPPAGGDNGVTHTCRDWTQVFSITEENYARGPAALKSQIQSLRSGKALAKDGIRF